MEQYQQSAQALQRRLGDFRPRVLLILGSGLGALADAVENPICVPYAEVPHMKRSTAPDHKGQFVFGKLSGQNVAVMQGRLHTYEGWSFQDVSYPVRVLRLRGAEAMSVTNAAGAVNTSFSAGDIMLISAHLKLFGVRPLCGPNLEEFGPRFPDMSHVYDKDLQQIIRETAKENGIYLQEGIYTQLTGPSFESPAEIRMLRTLGCDAVGMSTVVEAIAANHMGMRICGISCISNLAAGMTDQPLNHEEVQEAADMAAPRFKKLVTESVKKFV